MVFSQWRRVAKHRSQFAAAARLNRMRSGYYEAGDVGTVEGIRNKKEEDGLQGSGRSETSSASYTGRISCLPSASCAATHFSFLLILPAAIYIFGAPALVVTTFRVNRVDRTQIRTVVHGF